MTEDLLKKNTIECLLHALKQDGIRVEKQQKYIHKNDIPAPSGNISGGGANLLDDETTQEISTGCQGDLYMVRKQTHTSQFCIEVSDEFVSISSSSYSPTTHVSASQPSAQMNTEYCATLSVNILPDVREALEQAVTTYRLHTYKQALFGVMDITGYSRMFKLNSLDLEK